MNVKTASFKTVVGLFVLGLAVQASAAEKMYGVFMVVKGGVQIQSPGKPESAAKVGAKAPDFQAPAYYRGKFTSVKL